jgi:predicted RNA-binding Zn-ribbon protein involved in translation (DUF1610 family)
MPVVVSCRCGKQLRAPDHAVGKRVKCPGCGESIPVPGPKKAAAAPEAEKIRFSCSCGKQMQARAEFAGRATRCPACGETLTIPGPNAARGEARARIRTDKPAAPQTAPPADDDWEDEDDRPARQGKGQGKKKGSALPLILVGLLVFLLLAGGGGAAAIWYFWSNAGPIKMPGLNLQANKKPTDLDFVNTEAPYVISVRVGDLWNNTTVKNLVDKGMQQLPPGQDPLAEMEKKIGMNPSQIERVTMVVKNPEQQIGWASIATTVPYDRDKILSNLTGTREVPYAGKTYQVGNTGGEDIALYFPADTLVVVADDKGMKKFLDDLAAGDTGQDNTTMQEIKQNHQLLAVVAQRLTPVQKQQAGQAFGPQGRQFQALTEFNRIKVVGNLNENLELSVTASFDDPGKSQQAKTAVDGLLGLAKLFIPGAIQEQMKNQGRQAEAQAMANKVDELLQGINASQAGNDVTVEAKLPVQKLESIVKDLIPPGPGGGVPPPFPGGR